MISNKLIRSRASGKDSNSWEAEFNPPILIKEKSSISLQSFSMELTPDVVDIEPGVDKYSFSSFPRTDPNYAASLLYHTKRVPADTYTIEEFTDKLTEILNSSLFYNNEDALFDAEQGAEMMFTYDDTTKKISFVYAARLATEFCGWNPVDCVVGSSYEYTLSVPAAGDPALGTIERTGTVVDKFDNYVYTTNIFCRGSGEITCDPKIDNAISGKMMGIITGAFTAGGVFESDSAIDAADFEEYFEVGMKIGTDVGMGTFYDITAIANAGGGELLVTLNGAPNSGVATLLNNFILTRVTFDNIGDFPYVDGQELTLERLETTGKSTGLVTIDSTHLKSDDHAVVYFSEIVQMGNGDDIDYAIIIDDNQVTGSSNGWVFGLVRPNVLSSNDPDFILQNIEHGIMKLPATNDPFTTGYDYESGAYLIKRNNDVNSDWVNTNAIPEFGDIPRIVLGRRELTTDYCVSILTDKVDFDGFLDVNILSQSDFTYGNYIAIFGKLDGGTIDNIQWTASKLTVSPDTKTFYTDINPNILKREKLSNEIKKNNDGLGFYPTITTQPFVLNLTNIETAQLMGFQNIVNEMNPSDFPDLIATMSGQFAIDLKYGLPEMLKIVVGNLNLDSYDGNLTSIKQDNVLAFVPNVFAISEKTITYNPLPFFIQIKNSKETYLDHLSFKVYGDNDNLISPQISTSIVVLIQSYI